MKTVNNIKHRRAEAVKSAYALIGIIGTCQYAAKFAEENSDTPAGEGASVYVTIALEHALRLSEEVHCEFAEAVQHMEASQ